MASEADIALFQTMALEEQIAANVEAREPDRRFLQRLARDVFKPYAPVYCEGGGFMRRVLDPVEMLNDYIPFKNNIPVSGQFRGVLSRTVLLDMGDQESITQYEIGYYITENDHNQYFCPVGKANKIIDLTDGIDPNDVFETELHNLLSEEPVDIFEVADHMKEIPMSSTKVPLYAALLKTSLQPREIFRRLRTSAYWFTELGSTSSTYIEQDVESTINEHDVFSMHQTPRGAEILIRQGSSTCVYLSLHHITGFVAADRLALPIPYNADLRNPLC